MKIQFDSEKEMEKLIMHNDVIHNQIIRSYHDVDPSTVIRKAYSQVNIKEYGILDLVLKYRYLDINRIIIIELKNNPVKARDFMQLSRYITGFKNIESGIKITGGVLIDPIFNGDGHEGFLHNELKNNIKWGTLTLCALGFGIDIHSKDCEADGFDKSEIDLEKHLEKFE